MGRGVVFVVFLIGFVVFALIKYVFIGTKAAFEVVFDPNTNDHKVKLIAAKCADLVELSMKRNYKGDPKELSIAIHMLTPYVQSLILDHGYQVDSAVARRIVCSAIVAGGYATRAEVDCA